MDRSLSWTAMAECWPTCSFTSQMASSTCPGTTPASWWRTAVRATRTPMTIPHHKVGSSARPSVSALQVLMKTSQMPGHCHAVQNQQGGHWFELSWSRELVWESGFVPSSGTSLAAGHTLSVLLCFRLLKWDNNTKLHKFSGFKSECKTVEGHARFHW